MVADSHDAKTAFDNGLSRNSRIVRALAVAALLALPMGLLSACGDDDEPDKIAIDPEIEIATERDSAVTSTTAEKDGFVESDATAAPATTAASEPVRLGDRFEWCPSVQIVWDDLDDAVAGLVTGAIVVDNAQRAVDEATDELDKAEARNLLDIAYENYQQHETNYSLATDRAVEQIYQARESYESDTIYRNDPTIDIQRSSGGIAFSRAWEALTAVDPAVMVASDAVPADEPVPKNPDVARRDLEQELSWELGLFDAMLTEPTSEEERLASDREVTEIKKEVAKQLEERLKEAEREWKEHQHLETLLWDTVAGTPAYTAFKASFRESCA